MGMGLDHYIHYAFHVLYYVIVIYYMNYIHDRMYIGKDEH